MMLKSFTVLPFFMKYIGTLSMIGAGIVSIVLGLYYKDRLLIDSSVVVMASTPVEAYLESLYCKAKDIFKPQPNE